MPSWITLRPKTVQYAHATGDGSRWHVDHATGDGSRWHVYLLLRIFVFGILLGGFTDVKGSNGMLLRKQPVHPDIDPGQNGKEYGGDHAGEKPSAGGTSVEDGDKERHDIKGDQENGAKEGGDPLPRHFAATFRGIFIGFRFMIFFVWHDGYSFLKLAYGKRNRESSSAVKACIALASGRVSSFQRICPALVK